MKIEDLKEIIAYTGENEWIEFKVNDRNPQEIGEYISALSNSACLHNKEFGYLIFGIENSSKTIVGTNFKPKQTKVGNEELENWLATQLKPRIDFSIIELNVNSKTVIIFKIDSTIDTPIKFKGEEFIRVGSYKKRLSEFPEKARKIWIKVKAKRFEKEIALGNLDADTILQLLDYSSLFDLLKQSLPTNKDSILEKLEQEKLISYKLGLYNILNLGAILFAKDINKFESISRKAIRVVVYKGNNKIITEKEQLGKKGTQMDLRD